LLTRRRGKGPRNCSKEGHETGKVPRRGCVGTGEKRGHEKKLPVGSTWGRVEKDENVSKQLWKSRRGKPGLSHPVYARMSSVWGGGNHGKMDGRTLHNSAEKQKKKTKM